MSLIPHNEGTTPIANGITEYRSPTFENRIALPGWLCIGGAAVGGAWKGYTSDAAVRWTGWERRSEVQPVGNAILGALSGTAASLLVTLIAGGGSPTVTSDNAAKWLDKHDDRMILLPPDTLHPGLVLASIRGIARNADAAFVVHSMGDARLFLTAFHDSPHRDRVLTAAVSVLKRDSLPAFAQLTQGLPAEQQAVERYIAGIASFDEALLLAQRPGTDRTAIERRAAEMVVTFADLRRFMEAFPKSEYAEPIRLRLRDASKRTDEADGR